MPFPIAGSSTTAPIVPANPNFGSLAQATTNYVSTIYNRDPDEILRQVWERNGEVSAFRAMLRYMGFSRTVTSPTTGHYERSQRRALITIGAVVGSAPAAGASGVWSIAAASMTNTTITANGVAAWASDIQVGDLIRGNNGVVGRVMVKDTTTAPTAHQITVRPLRAADTIAFTNGTQYAVLSNSFGEATATPGGTFPAIFQYTNDMQIIKTGTPNASGTAQRTALFQQFVAGDADNTVYGIIKGEIMGRHERSCANALLFGVSTNNITTLSNAGLDVPVRTTEGWATAVQAYGHTDTYTGGAFVLADFAGYGETFVNERVSSNIVYSGLGYTLYTSIENAVVTQTAQYAAPMLMSQLAAPDMKTNTILDRMNNDGITYDQSVKAIQYGGFVYGLCHIPEFSDPTINTTGQTAITHGILAPVGQVTNAVDGGKGFPFGYEYVKDRETVMAEIGGFGSAHLAGLTEVNDIDMIKGMMLSEISFHGGCFNRNIYVRPA